MLPPETALELNHRGHDATSVADLGLAGGTDSVVFDRAVAEGRVMVTENIGDFSVLLEQRLRNDEPATPVVFARKADLPRRGALPHHLAERLHAWAEANPDPYLGPYWL
jgi:hypothetical protein